jgi:hypothetical protein
MRVKHVEILVNDKTKNLTQQFFRTFLFVYIKKVCTVHLFKPFPVTRGADGVYYQWKNLIIRTKFSVFLLTISLCFIVCE